MGVLINRRDSLASFLRPQSGWSEFWSRQFQQFPAEHGRRGEETAETEEKNSKRWGRWRRGTGGGKRYDMLHEEKNQMEDAGVGAKVWRQEKVNGEEKAVQIEGQVAGLIISKLQDLNLYQSINATFWRRRKKRPLLWLSIMDLCSRMWHFYRNQKDWVWHSKEIWYRSVLTWEKTTLFCFLVIFQNFDNCILFFEMLFLLLLSLILKSIQIFRPDIFKNAEIEITKILLHRLFS